MNTCFQYLWSTIQISMNVNSVPTPSKFLDSAASNRIAIEMENISATSHEFAQYQYPIRYYAHGRLFEDTGPIKWTWADITLSFVLGLIVLGTIVGNLLVLMHFVRSKAEKRTPTQFFITNLALCDFLVGVLVLPFLASLQVSGRWYLGQCFCTVWVCVHYTLCAASILSTCAICIERFIGVKYPLQHMRIMRTKRIIFALLCLWALAAIPAVTRVFVWTQPKIEIPYKCIVNQKLGHAIFASLWIFYVPSTIMVTLYFSIYLIASRYMTTLKTGRGTTSKGLSYQVSMGRTTTQSLSSSTGEDTERKTSVQSITQPRPQIEENIERRQISLAKKLFVLVGVVLVSYGPYFTLILLKSIDTRWVSPTLFDVFAWARYFNSFLNPIIYAYAVPTFNKAFKRSFLGKCVFSHTKK